MKKLLPFLSLLLLVALAAAGCGTTANETGKTGTLVVNTTDAPPDNGVTAIIVTIASVKVHRAGSGEATTTTSDNATDPTLTSENTTTTDTGEWIDIPLDGETTVDLLQIQGIESYLGSANLTAGTYTQVRLEISRIQVALNGGEPQDATLPSGVLKVARPFQIAEDLTTSITLDFEADKMVTVTGNGGVIVKPVVKLAVSAPTAAGQPATTPNN